MSRSLHLSQTNLLNFLTCRRRFQLRSLERLSWPDYTPDPTLYHSYEQGKNFHLLLERHFAGVPVTDASLPDKKIENWWHLFQNHGPNLPAGRRLPELRLTVPADAHFLIGRFDLLIVNESENQSQAHIFDWKTSKPRSTADLQSDWQTRLYLAMVAESGQALLQHGPPLSADQITLTYWYTGDPDHPRRIAYSQEWHEQNWAEILEIVADIDTSLQKEEWPLTANWSHCRRCPYQAYCGRWEAGTDAAIIHEEGPTYEIDLDLLFEPESP